jgi:uncharacterized protein YvpB
MAGRGENQGIDPRIRELLIRIAPHLRRFFVFRPNTQAINFCYNYFMRKISILLLFLVIAMVSYVRFRPVITYMSGKISVKLSQIGDVAGNSVYKLNVPWHRQEHALSCEIASLKMALAGAGVNIPESDLVSSLKFDPTRKANGVWGDPYAGFVGDIDGKMMGDGYGVYWKPIADVGLKYRRTEVIENGSLPQLVYHLNQNRPIVVWGYYGRGNVMKWATPEGRQINGVNGEHARVLVGYTGAPTNPESLFLLDPIYGELQWSVSDFMENWRALDNSAVVVYQQPRWVRTYSDDTVWEVNAEENTKHGLAMDWETFVDQGGLPEGVNIVSETWLSDLPEGEPIKILD